MRISIGLLGLSLFESVRNVVGYCTVYGRRPALPEGQTYSYKGGVKFADSTSAIVEFLVSINSQDSLTLKSAFSVSGKQSFTETFSVTTKFSVDVATCILFLEDPGLEKIIVDRTGVGKKTYSGATYINHLTRQMGISTSLVAPNAFGIVHPDSNLIMLHEKMKLQGTPTKSTHKPSKHTILNGNAPKTVCRNGVCEVVYKHKGAPALKQQSASHKHALASERPSSSPGREVASQSQSSTRSSRDQHRSVRTPIPQTPNQLDRSTSTSVSEARGGRTRSQSPKRSVVESLPLSETTKTRSQHGQPHLSTVQASPDMSSGSSEWVFHPARSVPEPTAACRITSLVPGSDYRLHHTVGAVSIRMSLFVQSEDHVRLHTIHSYYSQKTYKTVDSMIAKDLPYTINPKTCMLTIVGDKFDSVEVSRSSSSFKVTFPATKINVPGREYLNTLIVALGGPGRAAEKRVIGEVKGKDLILLDTNIELKKM